MTVCVAALCENGQKVVVATDCRLSYAGIASDSLAGKLYWFGDWMFLYAGNPSHIELINEELRRCPPLERTTIYDTVLAAYHRAKSKYLAHVVLSPFDLTMEEFKAEGLKMFGEKTHAHLSEEIESEGVYFNEHLLVVGWGDHENSANIFQIGSTTLESHALSGVAAIGSGAEVALSNLLLLKQARYSGLGNTLYAVASAKFSAEMSQDVDVGANTMMYVAWKRLPNENPLQRTGRFVREEEVGWLRKAWEEYGKPRIPDEAATAQWGIVTRIRQQRSEPSPVEDVQLRVKVEVLRQLERKRIQDARERRELEQRLQDEMVDPSAPSELQAELEGTDGAPVL
jgi:hypothetical protein